jgi:hypothetical protein
MRSRLLSGMCVVVLLSSGVTASGCGSSDDKRKDPPRYSGGGEGGAGIGEAGSGGAGSGGAGATAGSSGSTGDAGRGTAGDAGSGSGGGGGDAGGRAGAPTGGASDGGAGAGGPVVPFHGLYVGEDGDDGAAGTIDAPFKTLAHAATVAQAGDTIVFLDGSYTVGATAAIPAGVNLMANTSGAVTLTGTGTLLNLKGDIRIEGLKFQSYARVAYFGAGVAATGTVTLVDSTFTNCSIGLELTGSTSLVVSAEESFVLGNGGNAFAILTEEANLTMTGGILRNYNAGGVIRASEESSVSLTNVQVLDGTGIALVLGGDATAELSAVTFATLASVLIDQRNNSELTITDSDLSIKPAAATVYYCVSNIVNGTGSLTISNSILHDCGTAIRGGIYETMTITNVQFKNLTLGGMDLGYGGGGLGGTIRITGSTFENLSLFALRIGSTGNLNDFKIRNTSFNCSSPANWNCLYFDGSNASVLDLGTLSDPGGNTFLQGNANQSAVRISFQAINTTAVGNTWTPNVQDADAQGKYNAPQGAGQKLLISSPVAAGRNYQMPYGGTLLLAENP